MADRRRCDCGYRGPCTTCPACVKPTVPDLHVCLYFETWHYASSIELDLFDGERILNVDQGSSGYRNVWIEGNEETRALRFLNGLSVPPIRGETD